MLKRRRHLELNKVLLDRLFYNVVSYITYKQQKCKLFKSVLNKCFPEKYEIILNFVRFWLTNRSTWYIFSSNFRCVISFKIVVCETQYYVQCLYIIGKNTSHFQFFNSFIYEQVQQNANETQFSCNKERINKGIRCNSTLKYSIWPRAFEI